MAAAGAGLVWATTLLMCVALGAGELIPPNIWFPGGLPKSVRIYCKQNPTLNVAIRDGKVILATEKCTDKTQRWYVYPAAGSFALLNADTHQLMTIPSKRLDKVGLTSPSLFAAHQHMWTVEQPITDDGFYRVFVAKDRDLTLNAYGLYGSVHDGTDVAIYDKLPITDNAVWKLAASTC